MSLFTLWGRYTLPSLDLWCNNTVIHASTNTQSANQSSEEGHLCLPGLPGDEEEAVIGGINPVGASLTDHHSAPGVPAAAAAAVMLQKHNYTYNFITARGDVVYTYAKSMSHLPRGVHLLYLGSLEGTTNKMLR